MSAVLIVQTEQGKIEGFGEKGSRAYGRFLKAVRVYSLDLAKTTALC